MITDVVMPGMNGWDLAARLRESQPDQRVLLVSGYTSDMATGRSSGFDLPYLQKPFTIATLVERVTGLVQAGDVPQPPPSP